VAQKIFKVALVPSQAGDYTLPEIDLKWWDVTTGKAKQARIPARHIRVLPAVGGSAAPATPAAGATEAPAAVAAAGETPQPAAARVSSNVPGSPSRPLVPEGYWPWLTAFFALAWLVSSGLWLRARRGRGVTAQTLEVPVRTAAADPAVALKRLERACRDNDARSARQALLDWAAAQWPASPPTRLETVSARLGAQSREIVQQLDRGLYAKTQAKWDGATAWSRLAPLLEQARRGERKPQREPVLPPLYPQGA